MDVGTYFTQINTQNLIASAILVAGVVDDLRSRKFHNSLFLVCLAAAIGASLWLDGLIGLVNSALGFMAGLLALLPLFLLRIVGAGDVKLLAAFGAIATWPAALGVAVYSVIWGALLGLVRVLVSGQLKAFASNMSQILILRQTQGLKLQTIPYTAALLFGWLTFLTLGGWS